jgi:hypothetical protein
MSSPTNCPDDSSIGGRALWLGQVSEAATALAGTRGLSNIPAVSEISTERIAATKSIVLSVRREDSLNAAVRLAKSHVRSRSKLAMFSRLITVLAVALATLIFAGELSPTDIRQRLTSDSVIDVFSLPVTSDSVTAIAAEGTNPRLIIQPSRGTSDGPAPLGLAVQGPAEGAVVYIEGLVPGMELSTGRPVGADAWEIPATELGYAWIAPPQSFVGTAKLTAQLRLPDKKIADRQAIHLEWMTPISPSPPRPELDRESIPQLQPDRQDVQPQRITDTPHVAFLPLPQGVPQSTGAKGITVESRVEPEITNSTCFASASAVRQDYPEAWPSWTLRALGHEGTKCWYPTTRTLAHDHPK